MLDLWPVLRTVGLLIISNCFMTTAWYGHLRFRETSLLAVIFVSWLIALPEYALQVPANRWGYGHLSAYQLKIIQECIALLVFMGFSWLALHETPRWNHLASLVLVVAAVALAFKR
jgi:uncharacterized protein (DUF486 family)